MTGYNATNKQLFLANAHNTTGNIDFGWVLTGSKQPAVTSYLIFLADTRNTRRNIEFRWVLYVVYTMGRQLGNRRKFCAR